MSEQKDRDGITSDSEDDRIRRKDEIRKKLNARREGGVSDSEEGDRIKRTTMPVETVASLEEKLEKAKLARKAMQEDPSATQKVNDDLEKKLQAMKESRMKQTPQ